VIELRNVDLPLSAAGERASALLLQAAAKRLGVDESRIAAVEVLRRSVDARRKSNVHFVATLGVTLAGDDPAAVLSAEQTAVTVADREDVVMAAPAPSFAPALLAADPEVRPVVVGTGHAGLFAALHLAQAGARPLVLERGQAVDGRVRAVAAFERDGMLDPECNIQFGEGGAGTFSDGKLTTNTKDPRSKYVIATLVAMGGPAEIAWQAKPHIGTDKLVGAVRRIRERIIELGGEVLFETRLTQVVRGAGGNVRAVVVEHAGATREIEAEAVVLATGHSARDVFEMLERGGAELRRKPFSVGVRIEHDQAWLDRAQYGSAAGHPALGAADYKLACHLPNGRGVYTFCMCPGGWVVAAASEDGGVVTNGMSRFAREGRNSNAAFLVNVVPEDFGGEGPLAGVEFQRRWERAAFELGGRTFAAPAQLLGDFLRGAPSSGPGDVEPTYTRGVTWTDLSACLPEFVTESLRGATPQFDRKLRGFAHPDAILTGVETRSSSPVRIVRDDSLQSTIGGLYPCGEGAGYAGGSMSAAVDGIRCAEAVLERYS